MKNNFVSLLIPDLSGDVKFWVSTANIVYIEPGKQENRPILHINEGGVLRQRIAFIKLDELLNMVNDVIPPRSW